MIALWIRLFSSSWLNEQAAYALGSVIKKQLNLHFSEHAGVDYAAVLIEHLKQQFFNEKSKTCMLSMCSALAPQAGNMTKVQVHAFPKAAPVASIQAIESWFEEDQPIAVISDVHANLPALNTVLDDIQALGINRILCLGDIVGYGPHPSECIQRLQQEDVIVIRGNHDYMVGSGKDFSHGSQSSLYVAKWTVGVVSEKEREWLKTLPLQFRNKDMMLVHGAPRDPTFFNAYVYERTAEPNLQWMNEHMLPICFHGHSHLQGMYILQAGKVSLQKELKTYALGLHTASLICPGAVGQPRNGTPGAEYAIYYPEQKEVMFKRLEYDIAQVVADMKKFGFPEQLSTRLEQGF
jgi:predicted phosphodiesterase